MTGGHIWKEGSNIDHDEITKACIVCRRQDFIFIQDLDPTERWRGAGIDLNTKGNCSMDGGGGGRSYTSHQRRGRAALTTKCGGEEFNFYL